MMDRVSGLPLKSVISNPDNSDKSEVVDHPVFGKCFRLNGYSNFIGEGALKTIELNALGKYHLELEFSLSAYTGSMMFTTCEYDTGLEPGSAIYFPSSIIEYFQCNQNGQFQRLFVTSAGLNTLQRLIIIRDSVTTALNETNGYTRTVSNYNTDKDSKLCIGSYLGTNNVGYKYMNGFLKSLKISKL